MPVKYSILSSHADAKPKAGTVTSNYPKKSAKSKKSKKSEKKMGYGS
jgi:hypothetical protein